jgi:hypothetical protein
MQNFMIGKIKKLLGFLKKKLFLTFKGKMMFF